MNLRLVYLIFLFFSFAGHTQNQAKIDSLKSVLNSEIADSARVKTLIALGNKFIITKPDSSRKYYHAALSLAESIQSKSLVAKSYQRLGVVCYYVGEYPQSLDYYSKSLDLYNLLQDRKEISTCYNNMGIIYSLEGLYEKTLTYFLKSLEIDEELNDSLQMSYSLNNIGNVYLSLNNEDMARDYFTKALNIQLKLNNNKGLIGSYSDLGTVANKKGDFESARKYYLEGLSIAKKYEQIGVPTFYTNLGITYTNLREYDKATSSLNEAIRLERELGDKYGLADALYRKAILLVDKKAYDEAEITAKESLEIATELNSISMQKNAYEALYYASDGLKDTKNSLKYHVLFKQYNDSILNEDIAAKIHSIQSNSDLLRKERENEELKHENQIKVMELNRQKTIRNFIIIFAVLSLLYLLFLINRGLLIRRVNKELSEKNEMINKQKQVLSETVEELQKTNTKLQRQTEALQSSEAKLQQHQDKLEQLVEKRTEDLREKVEELEKFHDLFVQREFRIKELREKVKKLEGDKPKNEFDED